jgi:threonyl-tRNA synthetase
MRIAELVRLYRYEKSGELTGLMRVRSFCLADAHIICTVEQAKDEVKGAIDLIEFIAAKFGLEKGKDFSYRLSLGDRSDDKKYYKNDAGWEYAEKILRETLQELKAPYVEAAGEAAFYGPKIDIQMKNVLGKEDTAFTVQYDFCMPDRFDLSYTDKDGQEKRPVVIHRSSIGAIERVFGYLLEHYAGNWPVWLAPVQVLLAPVSVKHVEGAIKLKSELMEKGIRVEIDDADETVGNKVRKGAEKKIPYIVVVGDKELSGEPWMIRVRGQKDQIKMSKDEFVEKVVSEIKEKK